MTALVIRSGESQLEFVARILKEHGSISTYDALYNLYEENGDKRSITRLAGSIWNLRKSGWDIETEGHSHKVAVYHYIDGAEANYAPRNRGAKAVATRTPISTSTPDMSWTKAWRCLFCGGFPAHQPEPKLAGFGEARCSNCKQSGMFRQVMAS